MLTRSRCIGLLSLLAIAGGCDNADLVATNRDSQMGAGDSSASAGADPGRTVVEIGGLARSGRRKRPQPALGLS